MVEWLTNYAPFSKCISQNLEIYKSENNGLMDGFPSYKYLFDTDTINTFCRNFALIVLWFDGLHFYKCLTFLGKQKVNTL